MLLVRLYPTAPTASADNKMWVKLSSTPPDLKNDLAGTWVFNDTIDFTAHNNTLLSNIPLAFVSNGVNYAGMYIGAGTSSTNRLIRYLTSGNSGVFAYRGTAFTNAAYKTVEISTTFAELSANYANADLVLAFLQANATKQ